MKLLSKNGIAERIMNRTILGKVRCLLKDSGLHKKFWTEAVATACYQINISPAFSINFKTPKNLWTRRPPKLDHLKTFGCIGYVHKKEGKLDSRAKKAIFLGYPKGVKGFKLWPIAHKKAVISWDVVFNEVEYHKPKVLESNRTIQTNNFQFEVEIKSPQGGNLSDDLESPNYQNYQPNNVQEPAITLIENENLDAQMSTENLLEDFPN